MAYVILIKQRLYQGTTLRLRSSTSEPSWGSPCLAKPEPATSALFALNFYIKSSPPNLGCDSPLENIRPQGSRLIHLPLFIPIEENSQDVANGKARRFWRSVW
jgi:hypothetical protein